MDAINAKSAATDNHIYFDVNGNASTTAPPASSYPQQALPLTSPLNLPSRDARLLGTCIVQGSILAPENAGPPVASNDRRTRSPRPPRPPRQPRAPRQPRPPRRPRTPRAPRSARHARPPSLTHPHRRARPKTPPPTVPPTTTPHTALFAPLLALIATLPPTDYNAMQNPQIAAWAQTYVRPPPADVDSDWSRTTQGEGSVEESDDDMEEPELE